MSSPSLLLEDQLCFRFYTVVRLITRLYQPHLDRLGLTYPQYLVLLVLWEQDGVPLSHIVDRLGLNTKPAASRRFSRGVSVFVFSPRRSTM